MSRTARTLTLTALGVLALSACGSQATTGNTTSAPTSEPETTVADEPAPTDNDTAEGESTDWQTVEPGEWGHYSSVGLGLPKGEGDVDVKLDEWECDEDGEVPTDEGKKVCAFTVELKNTGKAAYQASEPGGVLLDNDEIHDPTSSDQDMSWAATQENSGTYVMDLNPGDTFTYYHVVSIPKDATPAELMYPAQTMVEGPALSLKVG